MEVRSEMQLKVNPAAVTDAGLRSENEDSYLVLCGDKSPCGTQGLLIVADGMGGSGKGGAASSMAVRTIADVFPAACQVNESKRVVAVRDLLRFAMQKANAGIYRARNEDPSLRGAGTACLAASVTNGTLYFAHIGDSRAYLLRDKKLRRLTEDEWTRRGELTIINQAVGLQPVVFPTTEEVPLLPDDVIMLCTDGLTEAVDEDRISEILAENTPEAACDRLLQETLSSEDADNVTIIVAGISR